jgi:hypothetical protein
MAYRTSIETNSGLHLWLRSVATLLELVELIELPLRSSLVEKSLLVLNALVKSMSQEMQSCCTNLKLTYIR